MKFLNVIPFAFVILLGLISAADPIPRLSQRAGGDPQTSLTLDPAVIASGFANNGQNVPNPGETPSLVSTNNFINFCLTVPQLPITNGKQIATGSCNPAPMGVIPSSRNMPSIKITSPENGAKIPANTPIALTGIVRHIVSGAYVNNEQNFIAAPQNLGTRQRIKGHASFVIDKLNDQTTPTDPTKFVFFQGIKVAAQRGVITTQVSSGLPAGTYRLCSIIAAANHQPVLVPVVQHGSLNDCIQFTVT